MIGRQLRRSNVRPCSSTIGVPLPWDSYARVDMGVILWERFCNVVP